MLWLIFIIFSMLWLLGMVREQTFGGFLDILLLVAIAAVLILFFQGWRRL